jgi:hypothetical protein
MSVTPPARRRGPMTTENGSLLPQHLADLHKSGLTDETIRACGFHSITDPKIIARSLNWKGNASQLGPCLAIPFVDLAGKQAGYQRLKPDRPRKDKDGKPIKYESPKGSTNQPYFPPGTLALLADPARPLLFIEGEKKSAKADQEEFPCVGLVGVYGWQRKRPRNEHGKAEGERTLIDALAGLPWKNRTVYIVFDSDAATNSNVRWAEWHLAQTLAKQGADVRIVRLPPGQVGADGKSAKVGLDDYLVDHDPDAFRALMDKAELPEPPTPPKSDRPQIVITTEEHEVNAEAVKALGHDVTIYQRANSLVRIVRDSSPAAKGIRRPLAPRIEALPQPILRERLAANACWVTFKEIKEETVEVPARPPAWCVAAVHARSEWASIRHLEAVVEYPVLRPDGTILCSPGYDPETGLLLEPMGQLPPILDQPTRDDAIRARDVLLEIVVDFPFALEAHKSAWLAATLTPLARFAFEGPTPLFLVDANVPGSGKGLLLDCICRIVSGERFTVANYTADEDELRKRITSLALGGDRLVLLDNLEGKFGNAVLDAALTATAWKDRVLGVNRMAEAPLYMTWYATGNNVLVATDTARRTCHIRLESPHERPEARDDFRHPDLLRHVADNRSTLLAAALTILRAYCAAGRPDQGLPPWGSFGGWSNLVRHAVVWVGMCDPGETRMLLQAQGDVIAEGLGLLLSALERADPDHQGLTSARIIDLCKNPPEPIPDWHTDLREAVEALVGKLDVRGLGNRLRTYRRRVVGDRFLDLAGTVQRAARWAVFPAGEFGRRPEKIHQTHQTHSPETGDLGGACESGESGESVLAHATEREEIEL